MFKKRICEGKSLPLVFQSLAKFWNEYMGSLVLTKLHCFLEMFHYRTSNVISAIKEWSLLCIYIFVACPVTVGGFLIRHSHIYCMYEFLDYDIFILEMNMYKTNVAPCPHLRPNLSIERGWTQDTCSISFLMSCFS